MIHSLRYTLRPPRSKGKMFLFCVVGWKRKILISVAESIKIFCPQLWCGSRQSLAKKWLQRSGGNHFCSSGYFWGDHFPITTEKRGGQWRISDGKWSTSCQSLVKVPSYTHPKNVHVFGKSNEGFSRKFGNVLCCFGKVCTQKERYCLKKWREKH